MNNIQKGIIIFLLIIIGAVLYIKIKRIEVGLIIVVVIGALAGSLSRKKE